MQVALINLGGLLVVGFFQFLTRRTVKDTGKKVTEVHQQTNGNNDRLQTALEAMTAENKRLTNLLIEKEQKDAQG